MIVRRIKPEELKRSHELFSIAFECGMDNSKTAEQVFEEINKNPITREDVYWKERFAAFEDDDHTMMSYLVTKPYPIHYDNHHCTMYGVGGVSTLPQYRRRGGIRACFEKALPCMYESGAAFSYLYPFSTSYYRKFGYEMCCERFHYQLKLSFIPFFPTDGRCCLVEPMNCMLDDIKQLYEVWQNRYNMMIENEDFEYAWITQSNPVKDQIFTYIYKDKDGVPKAFATFRKEEESSGRNLSCSRFFFADSEGFQGLMNLFRGFSSDHQFLTFDLPTDQYIIPFLPEWSMGAGICERRFGGMARVINVKQVLEMSHFRGSGSLTIQIEDPFISQNNQRFYVRFEKNFAVDISITDKPADISLGIADFSRLITGVCDTEMIAFMPSVHITAELDCIAKVFYRKPIFLAEYF